MAIDQKVLSPYCQRRICMSEKYSIKLKKVESHTKGNGLVLLWTLVNAMFRLSNFKSIIKKISPRKYSKILAFRFLKPNTNNAFGVYFASQHS